MRVKYLLLFLLFFLARPLFSQDTSFMDKKKIHTFIDTLFIDHDRNNWSVRLLTNYKDNSFQLRNAEKKIEYTPNNPIGFGFGFGTRKIIFDVALNFANKDEERTDRFDFQAFLMLKNHNFAFTLQSYQGYDVSAENLLAFRTDIRSFSSSISYMYMFNAAEYSLTAMKTGLARQKKAAFSSGLGGFLFLNQISSDSSIVPQDEFQGYNEEIMIVDLQAIGAGVHASLNATIPFMKHFIASFSLRPGIGLVYKNVETESISYHPNNPLMYQFILGSLLGYNGKTYYINISMSYAYYKTSLDFGNSINYNTTIAKLALGFKLGQNRIFKNKND